MQISQKKHGGNVWAASSKSGKRIEDILDYSANISPLGTPEGVKQAILRTLDQLIHYPDPDSLELRFQLARMLPVDKEQIIVGNGSAELIYLLVKTLQPGKTLLLHPTFSEYEFAVRSFKGELEFLELRPENQFRLPVAQVLERLEAVDLLFICNPNNPTGCLTLREDLLKIIEKAQSTGTFVVVDEAFMDFVYQPELYSILDKVKDYSHLFVLRSLTKFYALPGLRIGAGFGQEELLRRMNDLREPWTVNSLAQAAAKEALLDHAYGERLKKLIWQEKEFLFAGLGKVKGVKPYPPSVNYIFLDIKDTGKTATQWTELLACRGVLVRNCNTYPFLGEGYLRVAVRGREENEQLLRAFNDVR